MSEVNTEVVIKEMPGAIEEVQEAHINDLNRILENFQEMAKKLENPQVDRDIAALEAATRELQDFVKRMCGEEGDTVGDTGSFWSVVTAAKKLEIAMGGNA